MRSRPEADQENKFLLETFGIKQKDITNTQNAGGGLMGGATATRFETEMIVAAPKELSE
jgi:hypothetical protein